MFASRYSRQALLLVMVVCSVFRLLRSEYVIVKSAGQELLPVLAKELDPTYASRLHRILNTYQWPTALAFYEQGSRSLKQELEETVFAAEPFAEQRCMTQKMSEFDPSLRAIWMPNTLYELLAVYNALVGLDESDIPNAIKAGQELHGKWLLLKKRQAGEVSYITTDDVVKNYRQMHSDIVAQTQWWRRVIARLTRIEAITSWTRLHMRMNELIGKTIIQNAPAAYYCEDACYRLANDLVLALTQLPLENLNKEINQKALRALNTELENELLKHNGIIMRSIRCELAAQGSNQGLVFRGTVPIPHAQATDCVVLDSTLCRARDDSFMPRSISYGNSLFAGCLFDPWGTAFVYMSHDDEVTFTGYTCSFNKLSVARNTSENMFFIPPLSMLQGIFAAGQYFHPRLKAVTPVIKHSCIEINGIMHDAVCDPCSLVSVPNIDSATFERRYLAMLADNVTFLTDIKQCPGLTPQMIKDNMKKLSLQ